jgi:hypothetical protein
MIQLSTYSKTCTFALQPKALTLTRRYEEDQYAFVAGDVKIDAMDAEELYQAIKDGDEVSLIIKDTPSVGDPICKFRGTFQSDGSGYDPETEQYTFTVLHHSKKIFEKAKDILETTPNGITYYSKGVNVCTLVLGNFLGTISSQERMRALTGSKNDWCIRSDQPANPIWFITGDDPKLDANWTPIPSAAIPQFDLVVNNSLHTDMSSSWFPCKVLLDKTQIEFANTKAIVDSAYFEFIHKNQDYSLRDYWLDFSKHYRLVLFIPEELDAVTGLPILNVVSRAVLAKTVHTGYDDLIASYSEEVKSPQYNAVIFPFKVMQGSFVNYNYGEFRDGVLFSYPFPGFASQVNTENALDLRVPAGMYKTSKSDIEKVVVDIISHDPNYFPLKSIPTFKMVTDQNGVSSIPDLDEYLQRVIAPLASPYTEATILYSQRLPVNPCETIVVRGVNIPIAEIEDDLVNETTKIIGRIFAKDYPESQPV